MNRAVFTLLLGVVLTAPLRADQCDDAGAAQAGARPGPPPGTYTITPDADLIRIPFELFRGEIRLIGQINDQEVRMLVDNGALWDELLFFGSPRVDALGLKREGEVLVGGAGSGDPVQADLASGIDIRFGAEADQVIEFQNQTAICMPYASGQPNPWEGSEGQVSSALFKNFVVGFDFDQGVLTLVRPEAFDPEGQGTELPLQPLPGSVSWAIPGALTLQDGRRVELDLAIDLGWDEPLAINTGLAHDLQVPEGLTKRLLGLGAQGAIYGYLGTVPVLQIGEYRLSEAIATYSTVADGGAKQAEVLVGLGTFARFHIYFDYLGHRLFVKPNQKFAEPFVTQKAG